MDTKDLKVEKIRKVQGQSKLRAFVDVCFGEITIKGLRVVEGANGFFVSMPKYQGKDGRWYSNICPKTKEAQKQINDLILQAYLE
ncbi:MAG: septation protein spoVG [Candidatus Omnitrophota bacterium]|jgi:stage V sporulation protein G|nr:MAG: septation protein spoVG [Candidatus Omnitrophota bacterium]